MPEPTASEFAQVCVDRVTAEPDASKRLLTLVAFKSEANNLIDRAVGAVVYELRSAGTPLDALAEMTGLDRHTLSRRLHAHYARYNLRPIPKRPPLPYTEVMDPSSDR